MTGEHIVYWRDEKAFKTYYKRGFSSRRSAAAWADKKFGNLRNRNDNIMLADNPAARAVYKAGKEVT